jgi:DNA recombination protein RmuC
MNSSPLLLPLLFLLPVIALAAGWLLGRLRVHGLEVELAVARAELKSADALAGEREQALALAAERLRAGFDTAAGEALRGNSEMFLQMAGQVLGQQRERATRDLADREQAVAAMLAPVRDALQQTHEQIARIENQMNRSIRAY